MFPGFGVNSSLLSSRIAGSKGGIGLTLRTDLGYYVRGDTAFELSTSVSFNRVDDLLIWNTIFAFGYRARLPFLREREDSAPYIRVFAGTGPAVAVFEGERPSPYKELGAQRLQWEGLVGGVGVGLFRTLPGGRIWFAEATLTLHSFRKQEVIKSEGEIPVVISRTTANDGESLNNLHLILGVAVF